MNGQPSQYLETPIADDGSACDRCEQPLIEIDHYGERLTGCLECNVWNGSKSSYVVELSIEDVAALRVLSR